MTSRESPSHSFLFVSLSENLLASLSEISWHKRVLRFIAKLEDTEATTSAGKAENTRTQTCSLLWSRTFCALHSLGFKVFQRHPLRFRLLFCFAFCCCCIQLRLQGIQGLGFRSTVVLLLSLSWQRRERNVHSSVAVTQLLASTLLGFTQPCVLLQQLSAPSASSHRGHPSSSSSPWCEFWDFSILLGSRRYIAETKICKDWMHHAFGWMLVWGMHSIVCWRSVLADFCHGFLENTSRSSSEMGQCACWK